MEAIAKRPPENTHCCLWVSEKWHNFTGISLSNPHSTPPALAITTNTNNQQPLTPFLRASTPQLPLYSLYFSPWQPPGFFSESKAMVLGLWFNWNNICCTLLPPQHYSPLTTGITCIFSLFAEFCHFLLQLGLVVLSTTSRLKHSVPLCLASSITPFLAHPSTVCPKWTVHVFYRRDRTLGLWLTTAFNVGWPWKLLCHNKQKKAC